MSETPKEYKIIKNFIDTEKMSLEGYLYFLIRIPKNFIEWFLRYIPEQIKKKKRRRKKKTKKQKKTKKKRKHKKENTKKKTQKKIIYF